MLGNIEVPNMYTTVTPKSFLPPSPLRAKQFVMPLKLHQVTHRHCFTAQLQNDRFFTMRSYHSEN
jgi:hypothetical protein